MTDTNQILIYKTKAELSAAAQNQADKVTDPFKQPTYLYFIARYFVAVFECRFGEIPVQVWNEYRNALDHFFRHLTNNEVAGKAPCKQIEKMEGHLQRAALDVIKINCHRTQDSVREFNKSYKPEVIRLVDNGSFFTYLLEETAKAELFFEKAKIYDNHLGETAGQDKEVLDKYLEAVYVFDALKIKLIGKVKELEKANLTYNSIQDKASKGSIKHHFLVHVAAYLLMGVLVYLFHPVIKEYVEPIRDSFY